MPRPTLRLNRIAATLGLIAFGLATFAHSADAVTRVGQVSRIHASSEALTEGSVRRLAVAAAIYLNDVVTTGDNARIEITFSDGTRVTLGENARLTIDHFVFRPAENSALVDFAIKGAFRFITGRVGALTGRTVQVRTNFAVIGVRGTDFFGGPLDGRFGVLLFDGSVAVTGGQGEAILDRPGQGTNIAAPGEPPGPVTIWPSDKVARALAAVVLP